MQGKYKTNDGIVNVVEHDPHEKKVRILGSDVWISESQYSRWEKVVEGKVEENDEVATVKKPRKKKDN